MTVEVACYACGAVHEAPRARCDCGEPCWFAYDVGDGWPPGDDPTMWRFADWLPVDPPGGLLDVVGGTPLVRAPALDDHAGCRVSLKVEAANPTGSFKDRGSAVGVAWARRHDVGRVGTVSHGNMAMSVAAAAAAAELECLVLVPDDIPEGRLAHIAQFGPTVVRVAGPYGDLYRETLALGPEVGVQFVNSDDPLRVAGQGTVALEVAAASRDAPPDAVVLPTSSGGLASGLWRAYRDLEAAGLVDAAPRLYLVQADAASPVADAYDAGDDRVTAVPPGDTVAYSIGNPDPPSGTRALAAARATGGGAVAVSDAAMLEARRTLAREVGLSAETASAASLAGARRLAERGAFDADEQVVLVPTGTGFKEAADVTVDAPTVALEDLRSWLGGRLDG